MNPALEARIEGVNVATGDGVVFLSLGDKSVGLDSDDVQALVRTLNAADHLVEHGY